MDREEVIKWLKIMKANLNTFPEISGEKKIEALAEAIRLLKNEQSEIPTGSDDCISRAQAIRELKGNALHHVNNRRESLLLSSDRNIIRALPPVTPIRAKGHWCPQNDDYFDWYECSECGYGSEGEMQYSSEYDVRTNFCPNCGADMRTSEENDV